MENFRQVENLWRQKSRVNWIKLGDRNTRFFQITAKNRYRKNLIDSIRVDGSFIEEPNLIKSAAVNHFNEGLKEEVRDRSLMEGIFRRKISVEQAQDLERRFEMEEIVDAMKDCNNLKAPGPDGFNFSFVK